MTNRRNETGTRKLFAQLSVVCVALIAAVPGFAGTSAAVFPTGLTFSPQTSGTVSVAQTATVYNIGSTPITVTGVTTSVSQFVATGTVPVTIQPSQWANFTVTFNPNLAKTFSGTLTVTITGFPSQKVTLSGVGTSTTAIASLNAKSLTFPSQTLGSASPTQAVTITNTGTTSFKVSAVTLTYPFSQTGFSGVATTIAKGKSLTMQVSFFPTASGVTNGTMSIVYDSLPPVGLSLSGTGAAPSSLAVTNYPTLPSATQNAAYQDTLTAQGGAPPYIWTLASGSLPSGLTLASSGTITGSLASSVTTGNYSFTATATDSNLATSSATLTLPVYAPTGAECNNIIFNAADGSGPLVPINDLGTGYYLGVEEGGLYANGSNVRPAGHDASGVSISQAIQPLDSNGNPSPTGKEVFISIGESIAQQPFIEFMILANADPSKNPNLVIVNGATGGATASDMASLKSNFWNVIINNDLPNAGVTPQQVVVAWINDVNGGPSGTFPTDMTTLQGNTESIAQNLLTKFPNIKLAYFSSINYTGYSNGLKNLSNEPWSYEAGFAVKNAIQDQINGNANLNFDPTLGPVLAPWIDWGPYYWANGLLARSDGLEWTCQDLQADGTHPSIPVGRIKVSTQLLNFLKSDDTASIWFLAQ
ncbi:MAG: choice-of-anchor D domain-containing protein [Candidatus Sulfotelmatobacter sp.]